MINVASIAHTRGRIHLDDLTLASGWTGYAAYAQSKLANVMHAMSLAERHDPTKLVAYSLHPGRDRDQAAAPGLRSGRRARRSRSARRTSVRLAGGEPVDEPSGSYFSDGVATPPAAAARDARGPRARCGTPSLELAKLVSDGRRRRAAIAALIAAGDDRGGVRAAARAARLAARQGDPARRAAALARRCSRELATRRGAEHARRARRRRPSAIRTVRIGSTTSATR